MYTCYECGKQIKTKRMIITNPPIYMIKLGLDFAKALHVSCHKKAEQRAKKELYGY